MANDREAEMRHIEGQSKAHPDRLPHDPNLTAGERSKTPAKQANRAEEQDEENRRSKNGPAPIIQRTP